MENYKIIFICYKQYDNARVSLIRVEQFTNVTNTLSTNFIKLLPHRSQGSN